jgi:hypothetical protein
VESNAFVRFLGKLCVGIGAGFACLTVYPPIADALAGKPVISIHRTGVGGALGVLLCGFIFLIAGARVRRFMVLSWRDATPLNVCGSLAIAAAFLAFQVIFERYFASLGFVVRRFQ